MIDLGCGPGTGGLALAAAMGAERPFPYLGIDPAAAMHRLGEKLATTATKSGNMAHAKRSWWLSVDEARWAEPPGWRAVIVIASYLLASPTLDATDLVTRTLALIERISWGPVTLVYTNAVDDDANRKFASFRTVLEANCFTVFADDIGAVTVQRQGRLNERHLRYALFYRPRRTEFSLKGRA